MEEPAVEEDQVADRSLSLTSMSSDDKAFFFMMFRAQWGVGEAVGLNSGAKSVTEMLAEICDRIVEAGAHSDDPSPYALRRVDAAKAMAGAFRDNAAIDATLAQTFEKCGALLSFAERCLLWVKPSALNRQAALPLLAAAEDSASLAASSAHGKAR